MLTVLAPSDVFLSNKLAEKIRGMIAIIKKISVIINDHPK
jgi:hypothetical protein